MNVKVTKWKKTVVTYCKITLKARLAEYPEDNVPMAG